MSINDRTFSTLLIELDALLDTRIACLAHLSNDRLREVITKGYHSRDIDQFPGISFTSFKKLYDKRDKHTLKHAMVSNTIGLLVEFVNKTLMNTASSPFHFEPKIIINIYPYELDEEEIKTLVQPIIKYTKERADIEIVSKSIKELTVGYVKDNLSILVLYNYMEWLEFHSKNKTFERITCPEVTLLGPAIYFQPKVPLKDGDDPFTAVQELAAPLIGLKLLDIKEFSFIVKPAK